MSFKTEIITLVGEETYIKLEREAEKEVACALRMPLVDEYRSPKYYRMRYIIPEIIDICSLFEEKGMKISPADIVEVLFRCKLLFAVPSEDEYRQRAGGVSHVDENNFAVPWSEKGRGVDNLIEIYLDRLQAFQQEKTLIVEINSFDSLGPANPQTFLDALFQKLNLPFLCYIDQTNLRRKHRNLESGLRRYTIKDAKRFFCFPSLGFKTFGSSLYCRLYADTYLRTFLNMLRIASFLNPGQVDFGHSNIEIIAPTSPVFLGTHSIGSYSWNEDRKQSWEKNPDGCLFLSFGYRGISKMHLDSRSFPGIEAFMINNTKIFDCLKNPWEKQYLEDIAPTLDMLSTTTQIQDLGAKILLMYCCLEHLFVPQNITRDNKKYIVGGINAIRPDLLDWFESLYQLRCNYAHKGFVIRDDKTFALVMTSIRNILALLLAKLSIR